MYYHNGTIIDAEGNIIDAEDGSYRYAGGDYRVADAYKSTYDAISDVIKIEIINSYDKYYLVYDESKTYYNTIKEVISKAISDGYIVTDSVDNFVCFGSNEEVCPNDNLYRIIGVFNGKLKLIKKDVLADYYAWDENLNTNWSISTLNNQTLNGTYLNGFEKIWIDKIAITDWKVGGNLLENIEYTIPSAVYKNEILNSYPGEDGNGELIYSAKVGLMYVSDYAFSVTPENWKIEMRNFNNNTNINSNWLYSGEWEWTITRESSMFCNVFTIFSNGLVFSIDGSITLVARPTFYLNSNIIFAGGTGTESDPYRIA